MKKFLIALLMMAVVIVGVFADAPAVNDVATLNITTEIKIQYPVYSLQATSWVAGGTGDHAALGSAATVTPSDDDTVVIGDDVLTSTDTTVEFTIKQTTLSRIKGTYTLTVAATDLVIDQITKQDGTKEDASAAEKTANKFSVSAAPTITKGASGTQPTNTTEDTASAGVIGITYNGKKVAADTTIGKFQYTWTHDENAAAGDYKATVTLTITSIN